MTMPAIRFRVDFGRDAAVGPGKIELLEHIGSSGSLSQAARELGMSYRRAWQLLASLNVAFRERVVLTAKGGHGGGGARLTPTGRLLVREYRDFEARVQRHAARAFGPLADLTRPAGGVRARRRVARIVRLAGRHRG